MGWQISQKKGKFRIWSTVTDSWLSGWMDRKEAMQFYHEQMLFDFKKNFIQKYLSFPHHSSDYDNHKHVAIIINKEGSDRWRAWMEELLDKSEDEYYKFVNDTFDKIMKEIK